MPELDYMVMADYVRADNGVLHMIGAGFDTMWVPILPSARQVGVGLRLLVDVADARVEHRITLLYQNADGQVLLQVQGNLGPAEAGAPLPPEGRPYGVTAAFNLPIPIPGYGDYSLELFIDDATEPVKSITLTAAPMPAPGPVGHA